MFSERPEKKQRMQNACDSCRNRKIRCDSEMMPEKICSSCLNLGIVCTHSKTQQRRGPKPGSIRTPASLPVKILVTNILAGTNFNPFVIPQEEEVTRKILIKLATRIQELEQEVKRYQKLFAIDRKPPVSCPIVHVDANANASEPIDSSEDTEGDVISQRLSQLSFSLPSKTHIGESSTATLVLAALDQREKTLGASLPDWNVIFTHVARPEFWERNPWPSWSKIVPIPIRFEFPSPDLLNQYIDSYFAHFNSFIPVLHRPTFERSVSENLHFHDDSFGAVVLGICAFGARLLSPSPIKDKAGEYWFNQIRVENYVFRETLELYHLQLYFLCLYYFYCTAMDIDGSWLLSGIAIRRAQEKGIHRRYAQNNHTLTVEGELWKRAFWGLISVDARMSTFFGRPGATSIQDFDLGPVIECDDEYWEPKDLMQAFVQPPGKPSTVSFWNNYIRLMEIHGFALSTIYSVRKSTLMTNKEDGEIEKHEQAVMELDSALNNWMDSVPEHLRWDRKHDSPLFFSQSAFLYAMYYWVQIEVHRAFIPRPSQSSSILSFPSLAICVNAARSCIHVCETHCHRCFTPFPEFLIPLLNAATVLALNLARSTQLGLNFNPVKEMTDIYKCIDLLRLYEPRYPLAGRFIDIINVVMFAGHYPPQLQLSIATGSPPGVSLQSQTAMPSQYTGSTPIVQTPALLNTETSFQFNADSPLPNLPYYSSELGELPVHRQGPPSHGSPDMSITEIGHNQHYKTNLDASPEQSDCSGLASFSNEAQFYSQNFVPGAEGRPNQPSQDWDSFMGRVDHLLNTASAPISDGNFGMFCFQ